MKKKYITTPLYYVNASPHIGHSYTTIVADVLARFYRDKKSEVLFLTGTDEHGQKIQKAAEAANQDPQAFVDRMVNIFLNLWKVLEISYDDFIRTTEERHKKSVGIVLNNLLKSDDLYKDTYEGWYCVPCETFWNESQAPDKKCPDCKREVEFIKEENYFFKLSKYQSWLIDYLKKHTDFIKPSSRYNEVLSFLESQKLSDLCISRPKNRLSWGIPIPFSPDHVVYVWFDALINYISAVGYGYDEKKFKKFWPADLHLIGKDILRQHAIYWPIMLKALGLEMPKAIFAHGWWMVGEDKMSKSKGNVVDPTKIVEEFGLDAYRYFLLRDVPFGADGFFSHGSITKRYNGDLANDLGNLVHRTATMIEKYFEGKSSVLDKKISCVKIKDKVSSIESNLEENYHQLNFSLILTGIWELINIVNKHIEDTKPWELKKAQKDKELKTFISDLYLSLKEIHKLIQPFMPATAEKLNHLLNAEIIKKGEPLFPRIEIK